MNKQTSYICSIVYYTAVKSHALIDMCYTMDEPQNNYIE